MAEEVDGFEVHSCLGVPDVFAHFGGSAGLAAADVVDEDVDAAVLCDTGVDDGAGAGGGGCVAVHDGDGVGGGFSTDLGGGALGGGEGDVAAEEGGALAGEEVGDCGAVAPACRWLRGELLDERIEGGQPSPTQPMPVMRATLLVRSWRGIEDGCWRTMLMTAK